MVPILFIESRTVILFSFSNITQIGLLISPTGIDSVSKFRYLLFVSARLPNTGASQIDMLIFAPSTGGNLSRQTKNSKQDVLMRFLIAAGEPSRRAR